MKINWFPGHMTKALGQIKGMLSYVDAVIYVLDGRAPLSCLNPSLSAIAGNKPVLFVVNKIDLADMERVSQLLPSLRRTGSEIVTLNSTLSGSGKQIRSKLNLLCKDKIEKYQNKGVKTSIRAVVVGVPNCGKSTLVNNLCGKAKTTTGDRPGVTKVLQWLAIGDNVELCDTPGTLYPNLADQTIATKLACLGSIKEEILDTTQLAQDLLQMLQQKYPDLLQKRYKNAQTLDEIGKSRGFVHKGGEIDIDRTASALLDDFRKGRLGKITLD